MNVPNHEKKAFKDITPEERSAIVEAWIWGNAEYFNEINKEWRCKPENSILSTTSVYRTRPRKLVIPWEIIHSKYKFAFMTALGSVVLSPTATKQNKNSASGWEPMQNWWFISDGILIDTSGIDWRESLTRRPE